MGQFLQNVAQTEKDPVRMMEHAHKALTFLYRELLHVNLGEIDLPEPPRLLDRMRWALRVGHYSPNTEGLYAGRIGGVGAVALTLDSYQCVAQFVSVRSRIRIGCVAEFVSGA